MQYKYKGEITVFLTLVFSVFTGLVLTIVESARLGAMRIQSENAMQSSIHSVFGEYNQELLLYYELFAIDSSFRGSNGSVENVRTHLSEYAEENFLSSDPGKQKSDWLKLHVKETDLKRFQLLSDENGAVLIDQAIRYEKEKGQIPDRSDIVHAKQSMQEDVEDRFMGDFAEYLSKAGTMENPAEEVFETAIGADLLDLVIDGGYGGESMRNDCASRRSLKKGTYNGRSSSVRPDSFLFDAYLLDHFGTYVEPLDHAKLACETEYLITGNNAENDCLRECARRILSQREQRNLEGFLDNEEVLRETEELANRLCEGGGDPYSTRMSLLYAWVYTQSVIEVSRLLYGGSCLMDGSESPVVPLSELTDFTDYCYACGGSGEPYRTFLTGLLAAVSVKNKAFRCMDLIEINLQRAGYAGFRVDTSITYFCSKLTVTSDYGHSCSVEREYGYFAGP